MIKSVTIYRRGVMIIKVIDRKKTGIEMMTIKNMGIETDLTVDVRDEKGKKVWWSKGEEVVG